MENFYDLLEQYLDDDLIKEKKKEEIDDYVSHEAKCDIEEYRDYAITIKTYLQDYLGVDVKEEDVEHLTHKGLKQLMCGKGNLFVIGISNDCLDYDEVFLGKFLVVRDACGNLGSYLNPLELEKIMELEVLKKKQRILSNRHCGLDNILEYHKEYLSLHLRIQNLEKDVKVYLELLERVRKSKVAKDIKRYVKKGAYYDKL